MLPESGQLWRCFARPKLPDYGCAILIDRNEVPKLLFGLRKRPLRPKAGPFSRLSRAYSSRKKSSSTLFRYSVSSIRTPTLCRIIKVASCSRSISTIRKGWRSAKLLAGWVKYDVVTNTPLLAFAAPRLALKALTSGSLTALSMAYRFAWI